MECQICYNIVLNFRECLLCKKMFGFKCLQNEHKCPNCRFYFGEFIIKNQQY